MKSLHLKQFLYSLLLVFIIPTILVFNLFWHTSSFNQTLNTELQRKAVLFARAISPMVVGSLANPATLTTQLHSVLDTDLGMKEITVYQYDATNQNFSTLASTDASKELEVLTNPSSNLAWKTNQSVASLDTDPSTGERAWTIITPLKDSKNQKVALLLTKLSVADVDALAQKSFQQSLIVLMVSVLLILILLFNHFHFVSYAKLYRDIQSLNQVRNTFMNRAAHDLEQPIDAASRLASNLAKQTDSLGNTSTEMIESLVTETSKAQMLMRTLNAVDQSERGQTVSITPINLARIAKELTERMRPAILEKDLHILTSIPNPQGIVRGDATVATQILQLMFDVCIEHITHGSISVTYCAFDASSWVLAITSESFRAPLDAAGNAPDASTLLGLRYWLGQNLAASLGGKLQASFGLPESITIQLLLPLDHLAQYPASAEAVTTE